MQSNMNTNLSALCGIWRHSDDDGGGKIQLLTLTLSLLGYNAFGYGTSTVHLGMLVGGASGAELS